jgi:hypothetical protein
MTAFETIAVLEIAVIVVLLFAIWRALIGNSVVNIKLTGIIDAHLKGLSTLKKAVEAAKKELAALNKSIQNETRNGA